MDRTEGKNPTRPESLKGYFLISEANMVDPNFARTVVLIIEHNGEGAFGLVVNRRSQLSLSDVLPEFNHPLGQSVPIYVGGPVQQEYIFVVHSPIADLEPSEQSIMPVRGVVFEPSFRRVERWFQPEFLSTIPADDRPNIHIFLGYSGWAAGQLEYEMQHSSWITHPAKSRIVFHPNPQEGWFDALREKGGIYRIFADARPDPSLN